MEQLYLIGQDKIHKKEGYPIIMREWLEESGDIDEKYKIYEKKVEEDNRIFMPERIKMRAQESLERKTRKNDDGRSKSADKITQEMIDKA